MTRLPILNAKTIKKVLVKLGFEPVRQKGSHVFYRHPDGRTTTVPFHAGRDIARPLLFLSCLLICPCAFPAALPAL